MTFLLRMIYFYIVLMSEMVAAAVSQTQRNSQRGVGTACQSRGGSHSQGCHWRKRLESCVEIERDKDRGERERRNGEDGEKRERGRGETH